MLREPLRYAPGSRGNACARPASSRIRSCKSSDCNHHLSKSICKVHRVYVYVCIHVYTVVCRVKACHSVRGV